MTPKKTIKRKKVNSQKRNDLCHCGSGKPYKLCHFAQDHETTLHTGVNCKVCGNEIIKDLSNDFLIIISNGMLKWHNYYKHYQLYKFSTITIGHMIALEKKEKEVGTLSKKDLFNIYIDYLTKPNAIMLLKLAISNESFLNRKQIISDAIDAHFDKKFTLSIPTLFPVLEGIIREIQGLSIKATFECKFDKESFAEIGNFFISDCMDYFNLFINKLYEGQASPTEFNRNPILHGVSTEYYCEEHSLILILSIFEIASLLRMKEKYGGTDLFS